MTDYECVLLASHTNCVKNVILCGDVGFLCEKCYDKHKNKQYCVNCCFVCSECCCEEEYGVEPSLVKIQKQKCKKE